MMSKTVDRNMFDTPLLRKLFELNDAMREAYRACVEQGAADADHDLGAGDNRSDEFSAALAAARDGSSPGRPPHYSRPRRAGSHPS
jgi:hypothetical protein